MTFTDAVVAQKVVNMHNHTIRKSNLNVSFADPKGGAPKAGQFPGDPFAIQMGYPAMATATARHPGGGIPRYFPGQQQQTYTLSYGPPQHIAAIQRPDVSPNAMVRTQVLLQSQSRSH